MYKSVILLILASFSSLVFAEMNIAILDKNAAMFQSEAARIETEKLKSEFGVDEQRIVVIEQQVTDIRARLETDSAIMNQDDVDSQNVLASNLLNERQTLIDKLQQIQQQRQQVFIRKYQPILAEVIQKIIEEQSIDFLLDAQTVIFAKDGINITQDVLTAFNKRIMSER